MTQRKNPDERYHRITGRHNQKRRRVFLGENPFCVMCAAKGIQTLAVEVDHIIPLYKGGEDSWENLQGLCVEHHQTKTRKDRGWKEKPRIGLDGWPEDE